MRVGIGIAMAVLLAVGCGFAAEAAEPPRRPNIVFFLCDDLGTGDLSCLGSKDIETPNIDALFARGTRLSRHWAGSAVCAPSRCVLLTGKHPGHAAVRSNREAKPEGQFPMPAGTLTLPAILKAAGYATGGFGKWGLGAPGSASDPVACGFDRFFGYNCQREAHTFYPGHLWDNREKVILDNPSLAGDPAVARGGTLPAAPPPAAAAFAKFSGPRYSADLIAEQQLAFVRANATRPFFLYVPTTVPHLALQVPADEPSLADYERHFGAEQPYLGGRGYVPNPRPLATYAAMITRLDREVGRLVSLLDDLKLSDDTIFVFSSDNGATMPGMGGLDTKRLASNGPLRDWKGSPYEGGLRVPTVAVWPGSNGWRSDVMPVELMSTMAVKVTRKMSVETRRLRSRNSRAGERAADVAARRAPRPPTMSFHWFFTDMRRAGGGKKAGPSVSLTGRHRCRWDCGRLRRLR